MTAPVANAADNHGDRDDRHGNNDRRCRGQFEGEQIGFLCTLDHIGREADDIIADGGDGQSFNRLLKSELHLRACVHRPQQGLILLFDFDINPCPKEICCARQFAGEIGCPLFVNSKIGLLMFFA